MCCGMSDCNGESCFGLEAVIRPRESLLALGAVVSPNQLMNCHGSVDARPHGFFSGPDPLMKAPRQTIPELRPVTESIQRAPKTARRKRAFCGIILVVVIDPKY